MPLTVFILLNLPKQISWWCGFSFWADQSLPIITKIGIRNSRWRYTGKNEGTEWLSHSCDSCSCNKVTCSCSFVYQVQYMNISVHLCQFPSSKLHCTVSVTAKQLVCLRYGTKKLTWENWLKKKGLDVTIPNNALL